jgi:hypothetical protein
LIVTSDLAWIGAAAFVQTRARLAPERAAVHFDLLLPIGHVL